MNQFDVVIIGAGPSEKNAAAYLSSLGRSVAMIPLPNSPETLQQRLISLLTSPSGELPPGNSEAPVAIKPESPPKYEILSGPCHFESSHILRCNDRLITGRRFILAPGATEAIPALQGLDQVPFLTPLSLFSSKKLPSSAIVIGGGPIGVATAARLMENGARVTLISNKPHLLDKEDRDISKRFQRHLQNGGAEVCLDSRVIYVRAIANELTCAVESSDKRSEINGAALVVATGLQPNTRELNLRAAEVVTDENGWIAVNDEMRTSSPNKWAIGAATGTEDSLTLEPFQAELAAHNVAAPFFSKRKLEPDEMALFTLPTSPAFSRVGMSEIKARQKYKDVLSATVEDPASGRFIKLVGRRRGGEILGAHILGAESGSIGLFFELAMRAGISVVDLAESRFFPPLGTTDFVYSSIKAWMRAAG